METITVEAVTKEAKESKGRRYWGVKSGNRWINMFMDTPPQKGQKLNAEIKTSEYNGKTYHWGEIVTPKAPPAESHAASNGAHDWADYRYMAKLAHELASELEPDSESGMPDRASARAAILNTVMIAFSNGKVKLPDEDEVPPPDDSEAPPF